MREAGATEGSTAGVEAPEPVYTSTQAPAPDPVHTGEGLLIAAQSLVYVIVVALFIMTFTAQPFRIPSASMEPTLLVGDFLLVARQNFDHPPGGLLPPATIGRGDVIVFRYPLDPGVHLVKRVIGLPGDRLRLQDNRVIVNGQALDEPYARYTPSRPDAYRDNFPQLETPVPDVASDWWIAMRSLVADGELRVPQGQYFVLGDNRNDSEDSRYWGLVPAAMIVGRPVLVYFSLNGQSRKPLGFARWRRMFTVVR